MKRAVFSMTAVVMCLGLAPSSEASEIVINDNRVKDTLDCDGGEVVLNGNHADLTLSGECEVLVVNGNRNRVAVEAVETIQTNGNQNEITWASGVGSSRPRVTNLGSGNSITQKARPSAEAGPSAPITKERGTGADVTVAGSGSARGERIVVNQNRVRESYECRGADVVVNGNDGDLTFEGECGAVTVNGNGNRVHVEAAVSISALGNRNGITWGAGVGRSRPRITNLGEGNEVSHSTP